MVPFLSFYSTRREGRYKKVRLKYPLSFNEDICFDPREGEIDGALTPTPHTNYYAHYVLSSTRTYSSLSHVRVHITFTDHEIGGAF